MNTQIKRIFIGLSIPHEVGTRLSEISRKLKKGADKKEIDVMWSPKEKWHVTLVFIGDTPVEKVTSLEILLRDFFQNERFFEVGVRKLGAFPEIQGARFIWAGVTRTDSFVTLRQRLTAALKPWGHLPTELEFTPHITLGRLRNHKNITDLLSPWIRADFGKINVNEAILYESQQIGPRTMYVPLVRYPLISD
ncbi:MAG: RNA 2',3'-cyclic phosphodiesterase [Pseudomonadota bacterium]|nr:RNA 2',3'-cyclic phosphodiesterase [Pseudomonadota bacterium]